MRLAPRSLGVRLALLLLLAVVGAQAVAFTMVALESSRVGRAVARTQFLDRAATLVRLLDAVPADAVPAVLEAYGSPRRSFTLDATSFVSESAMADDAARLAHRLDRRLAAGAGQARIALVDRDTDPDAPSDHGAGKLQALRVSVRLGDGRWLNGEAPLALQTPPWIRIGLIQAVASVVAVLAVAGIAMRGIVGPVSALARAAEMAGRGAVVEPLPERGPQELRTMTAAFNGMQARSRAFVADRTRMLAAISHDLRTPIASLWLRAEMVEDADLRGAMVRTISEMGRMVDATLAFAREDALVQDSGPLDLAAMVRALVADHAVLGREVSVAAPMHLPFHGRAMTLRRALDNLVDNAVRYGDRARITLESGPDSVRILVDDDGPGMPPDRVEEMFAPFTRLEVSRNAETGGTGLGLAIVRSAVRAHGGDIRMSNRPGGGLRAEITLSTREPGPSDERSASRRAMPDVVARSHL